MAGLTARAEIGSPAAEDGPLNGFAAARAGRARPPVNRQMSLIRSSLPVQVMPVGHRCPPAGGCLAEDAAACPGHTPPFLRRQAARRSPGADEGPVQDFTGVDVSDAGDGLLIQEEGFDRQRPAACRIAQRGGAEVSQGVGNRRHGMLTAVKAERRESPRVNAD